MTVSPSPSPQSGSSDPNADDPRFAYAGGSPSRAPTGVIHLIDAPRLRLGALTIDPAHRRIVHDDGREEVLEPRVMQVLVAFARAPGVIISRDDLIACCWEGRLVGDDAVNRVMSRLRRLSQEIGEGSLRLETLTKVGFRLIAEPPGSAASPSTAMTPVALAPIALAPVSGAPDHVIAADPQAAESQTAGSQTTEFQTAEPRATPGSRLKAHGRRLWIAVAGVSLAAMAGVGLIWRAQPKERPIPTLQLAAFDDVRPANATGAEQALRDELVAAFGRSANLLFFTDGARAPGGPSSFRLGGSVRQMGPALRFAFTLSRGAPGSVVWSKVIERPVAQAASAPQQVAAQVSFTVRCVLGGVASYPGELPQSALSDFAQYCAEVGSSESGESVSRMTESLRQTVAHAPDFAQGWAALGYTIADKFAYPAALWDAGSRTEASVAVNHALRLEPASMTAHLAKAMLTPWQNYAGREDELRLAVQGSDPFGAAHAAYARFLLGVGRVKEAAFMAERGYDIDQTDREAITRLIVAFYMLNHIPEADALVARARALWADSSKLTMYNLWAGTWDGQYQAALESLQSGRYDEAVRNVGPDAGAAQPMAAAGSAVFKALQSGAPADLTAAADTMANLAVDPRQIDPFTPIALAALGRDQQALAADERALKEWSSSLTVLLFMPPFANARRTAQFAALADRLGLLNYWRIPGRSPDFCKAPNPPPLCHGLR